jgi:hypothetical protein
MEQRPWSHKHGFGKTRVMDEPTELQHNGHWRMAVWALRVGYVGVATMLVGIIVLASGGTPWVLAAGVIFWVVCAGVTLTGFLQARNVLPVPRPSFWSMRWMIIHDTVHSLPSAQRT